jgi:hypothetical protein
MTLQGFLINKLNGSAQNRSQTEPNQSATPPPRPTRAGPDQRTTAGPFQSATAKAVAYGQLRYRLAAALLCCTQLALIAPRGLGDQEVCKEQRGHRDQSDPGPGWCASPEDSREDHDGSRDQRHNHETSDSEEDHQASLDTAVAETPIAVDHRHRLTGGEVIPSVGHPASFARFSGGGKGLPAGTSAARP